MPVTEGSGNPVWTEEETILALELLYRHGKPIDKKHSEVAELSALLRSAEIYPLEGRKENFRNADGVSLKLQNLFSAVVPGRGLTFSKTDKRVVDAYPTAKRGELTTLATAIRQRLSADTLSPFDETDDVEAAFVEGKFLTVRHRSRDRRLRAALLKKRRKSALVCEVCGFSPPNMERDLQESFFEAHHLVPLALAEGMIETRVSDAALICACCHRFVHRLIAQEGRWITMGEASQRLRP